MNPPTPGPEFNLKVQYNANAPPAHGENILYVCNAGSQFNRFESDFNRWNYSLTCQENNVFSEEPNVPWPTCVDSKIVRKFLNNTNFILVTQCANPSSMETSEIILTETITTDLDFKTIVK